MSQTKSQVGNRTPELGTKNFVRYSYIMINKEQNTTEIKEVSYSIHTISIIFNTCSKEQSKDGVLDYSFLRNAHRRSNGDNN